MTSDLLEENQKLRKRNTELQEEIAELRNNGFTVSAMTEQQLKAALEKGEQLEKENAELKKQLEISNKVYNDNLDYSHHIEGYLTKAKKIIKELVRVEYADFTNGDYSNELSKVLEQAEQFLSCKEILNN